MKKKRQLQRPPETVEFPARKFSTLHLRVTIPAPVVPFFEAIMAVHHAKDAEAFASRAVCKWLVSEEAVQKFDDLLNKVM